MRILQTELFQICSCLGNLHAVESGFQPELLNHFLHSGDAGRTRHGARESLADWSAMGPWLVSLRGQTAEKRSEGRSSELCLQVSGSLPSDSTLAAHACPPAPAPHPAGAGARGRRGREREGAEQTVGAAAAGLERDGTPSFSSLPLRRGRSGRGKEGACHWPPRTERDSAEVRGGKGRRLREFIKGLLAG